MKTKIISILLVITTASIGFGQKQDTLKAKQNKDFSYSWELNITIELPELNPEAIQIAILDFNPLAHFEKNFDLQQFNKRVDAIADKKEKEITMKSIISWNWDNLFRAITGNDMALLTKQGIVLSRVVTGDCAPNKMSVWLASKVFMIDGMPYCYALSYNLENGAALTVTLNKSNLISLTDLVSKLNKQ